RCTAATESRVSISGSLRASGAPLCAPFTTSISALDTFHMIDGAAGLSQKADQLAQGRGVVLASCSVGCTVDCHWFFHGQTDEISFTFERAPKKPAGNLANAR